MKLFRKRKPKRQILYRRSPNPLLHNQRRSRKNGIRNFKIPNIPRLKRLSILFTVLLAIGGISYLIFFSGGLKINTVQVYKDNSQVENDPLKNYFNSMIGQSIVFVNLEEATKKITDDNPQINNLSVKKRFPSSIRIDYTEFPVVANLLVSAEDLQQKYLINSEGRIVRKDIENPNLPYLKMDTDKAFKNQDHVIDRDKLDYILKSSKAFEEKFGIKVFDVSYLKEAREIHLRTEKYFSVWLDMTQGYDKQFSKLKKALINLDIYNQPLNYIDLRISGGNGDKVIFKRK